MLLKVDPTTFTSHAAAIFSWSYAKHKSKKNATIQWCPLKRAVLNDMITEKRERIKGEQQD